MHSWKLIITEINVCSHSVTVWRIKISWFTFYWFSENENFAWNDAATHRTSVAILSHILLHFQLAWGFVKCLLWASAQFTQRSQYRKLFVAPEHNKIYANSARHCSKFTIWHCCLALFSTHFNGNIRFNILHAFLRRKYHIRSNNYHIHSYLAPLLYIDVSVFMRKTSGACFASIKY